MTEGQIITSDYVAYPLRWGDKLASHDWYEFHFHEFVGGALVAHAIRNGRREDIATAQILICEALRQNPGGTLPDDDVQLAQLAKFGGDVDGWIDARPLALMGWGRVEIEGGVPDGIPRLGRPDLTEIAGRMFRRRLSRESGRKNALLAVQKTRIRKKLRDMHQKRLAENDDAVTRIQVFLEEGNLFINDDNLRSALDFIGVPRIVAASFGGGRDAETD